MEEQIKSVGQNAYKEQAISHISNDKFQSTEHQMTIQMNKTYDQCDTQKGLLSFSSKIVPILLQLFVLFSYLFFKLMTDSHLSLFILIVLLLAADFWITKNILGPKLVGLKWFSVEDENNNQKWCFASCSQKRIVAKINVIFFWIPQLLAIVFWVIIILINIITLGLFWVGLAIFSEALLVLNFAFFLQCKGEHQQKASFFAKKLGFNIYNDEKQSEIAVS